MATLSKEDCGLLALTILISLIAAIMALCFGLMLPSGQGVPANATDNITGSGTTPAPQSRRFNMESRKSLIDKHANQMTPNYNFLVSLNIPIYSDEPKNTIFTCNGVILSKNIVLTGAGCVDDDSEFKYILIRAGSSYWSIRGTEHVIDLVIKSPKLNLYLLKVKPAFEFSQYCNRIQILEAIDELKVPLLTTVGWQKKDNERFVRKYEHFDTTQWSTITCSSCKKAILTTQPVRCEEKGSGMPLISPTGSLLAIHAGNDCELGTQVFFRLHDAEILNWIGQYDETITVNSSTVYTEVTKAFYTKIATLIVRN